MFRLSLTSLALGLAAVVFSACQGAQYDGRYVYQPRPMAVETTPPDRLKNGSLRSLATIVGVRRTSRDDELPASVHLRLRMDNATAEVVTFDPRTLSLFAGDVREFPAPVLRPEQTLTLEPGDHATVDAFFPLPGDRIPGNMDLSGLGARWTAEIGGEPVPGSATFTRREADYRSHPAHGPRFNVGFGYHHHRRFR